MPVMHDEKELTLDDIVHGNPDEIAALCRRHSAHDLFPRLEHIGLAQPILAAYFSSDQRDALNACGGDGKSLATALFTPNSDFEIAMPSASMTANGAHSLSGTVRLADQPGRFLLTQADTDTGTHFAIARYASETGVGIRGDKNYPSYTWVDLAGEGQEVLAISDLPLDETSEAWRTILGRYGLAQAVLCLQYARDGIRDLRTCLDRAPVADTDFGNSQILSVQRLSSIEIGTNIAQVYVDQLRDADLGLQDIDGLVGLHAAVDLYSQLMHLSLDINAQLGRSDHDVAYSAAEFCAGGPIMSGMLVHGYLTTQIGR